MSNADLLTMERQEHIVQMVNTRGRLTVAEISEIFAVSEATVRRDLATLAGQNLIRRVHGGAMKNSPVASRETPILQRESEKNEIKQRIGRAAAKIINNGETLLLVGGSTAMALARELNHHRDLTVVTDSLMIANEILRQGQHQLLLLGGVVDPEEHAVRGTITRTICAQLQVDRVITGAKAISLQRGLSAETPEEAELVRSFISIGHHIMVLADATKFHQSALVHIMNIEDIHTLVTELEAEPDVLERIREKGVYVIAAP